jgi:CheY-like chemotaxis protein
MDKSKYKIMVVDDSEIFLKLLKNILNRFGYTDVILWPDPDTVIEQVQKERPNLILMDTHMPGNFGYNLCRDMKAMDLGSETGIVGMSDFSYHQQWEEADADIFLEKNILLQDFDRFKNTVEEILEKYSRSAD